MARKSSSARQARRISPARRLAFQILLRVERDAAYVTEILDRAELSASDHGLAQELTLGTLRWRGALDGALNPHSKRPVARLDLEVATALRLGAYQLLVLDKIPAHAAVGESVELVKAAKKASAAGMVNAILRKLSGQRLGPEAPEQAHPAWLVESWRRQWDGATLDALLAANTQPPRTYLRLNQRHPQTDTLALLADEGVETQPTDVPGCYEALSGRPAATRAFAQGRIRLQDIGSQAVAQLVNAQAGESFLDLCAAPGGKTMAVLERRGPSGLALGCDLHPRRLAAMAQLNTVPVSLLALDASAPVPFARTFDWVLLDAPCTGTGTLSRHPEIKWRLQPADVPRMAGLQQKLLRNALAAVAPGGRLIYATCSLEDAENRGVTGAVLATETQFRAEAYLQRTPGRDPGDGFFACRIVRNK